MSTANVLRTISGWVFFIRGFSSGDVLLEVVF